MEVVVLVEMLCFGIVPKCPIWYTWWNWRDYEVFGDVVSKFLHKVDLRTIELLHSVELEAHKNNIRRNVSNVIVQSLKACSPMSTLDEDHRHSRIEAPIVLALHLCDHVIVRDGTLDGPASFDLRVAASRPHQSSAEAHGRVVERLLTVFAIVASTVWRPLVTAEAVNGLDRFAFAASLFGHCICADFLSLVCVFACDRRH